MPLLPEHSAHGEQHPFAGEPERAKEHARTAMPTAPKTLVMLPIAR